MMELHIYEHMMRALQHWEGSERETKWGIKNLGHCLGLGIIQTDGVFTEILLFLGDEAILQTQTDPRVPAGRSVGPLWTRLRSSFRKTHQQRDHSGASASSSPPVESGFLSNPVLVR